MNANDRSIVALVMTGHGLVHTYELSIPIFMTVWLADLGVTEAVLGTLVGAGYAVFGIGALPGGIVADRWDSRRLIGVCLAGMGAAFLLLSLARTAWTIGGALVLWGTAASVYHPAGLSLISTGVHQRGRGLAWHGIAGNTGIAAGPLITALLLLVVDWPVVAAILALPALLAAVAATQISIDEHAAVSAESVPDSRDAPTTVSSLWRNSKHLFATGFAVVFAVVVASGLYYRGVLTFLPELLSPLVTVDLPIEVDPGRYVYAGLLGVGVFGQYVGGRLSDREGLEWLLALGFTALVVIALLFLPVSNHGTLALLGCSATLGFTLFVVQPLYQATVAEYTPADARGLSYGYTYMGVFGIGALGAVLAGSLLQFASPTALFTVLSGIALIGAGLSAWLALSSSLRQTSASPPARR